MSCACKFEAWLTYNETMNINPRVKTRTVVIILALAALTGALLGLFSDLSLRSNP